jgi:hypothetical protein
MNMERLSKLELLRLIEIVENIQDIVEADDEGITWGLEEDLIEAHEMLTKAYKSK